MHIRESNNNIIQLLSYRMKFESVLTNLPKFYILNVYMNFERRNPLLNRNENSLNCFEFLFELSVRNV